MSDHAPRRRRRASAGLTLVELMVTIVVASLVTTSTFMFFVGQQRIYESQTKILNMQQNIWAAVETITRYVRASGTGMLGCLRPDPDPTTTTDYGAPPPVGGINFPLDAPQTGLRIWYKPLNKTIRIPPLWITNGTTADSGAPDALTIAFGEGTFGNFADAKLATAMAKDKPVTDPVKIPGTFESIFRQGEFMVLLDDANVGPAPTAPNHNGENALIQPLDRGCTAFQISANAAGGTILHGSAAPYDRWNPPADTGDGLVPFTYQTNATITSSPTGVRNFGQLRWIRFYIRPAAGRVPPALMMRRFDDVNQPDQVLSEGIEDLQISYACDALKINDGLVNEGTTVAQKKDDEWVFNVKSEIFGAVPPPMCNKPDAIRITLIARSNTEDNTLEQFAKVTSTQKNLKPGAEDGNAGTTPTMFRYRTISTTIFPRN